MSSFYSYKKAVFICMQVQENMKAIDVIPLLTPAVMEKIEAVVQSKPKRPESFRQTQYIYKLHIFPHIAQQIRLFQLNGIETHAFWCCWLACWIFFSFSRLEVVICFDVSFPLPPIERGGSHGYSQNYLMNCGFTGENKVTGCGFGLKEILYLL